MRTVLAFLLMFVSSALFALDKGHIQNLTPSEFEYIAKSFESVNVYYPVFKNGGNILTKINKRDPKIAGDSEYVLYLFFSKYEASTFLRQFPGGRLKSKKYVNVLREQYKNRKVKNDMKRPLLVARQTMRPMKEVFEYFAHNNGMPYILSKKHEKIIMAFTFREIAILTQQEIKKSGREIGRVGLGEKQFINFIIQQGKNGILVKMFGG